MIEKGGAPTTISTGSTTEGHERAEMTSKWRKMSAGTATVFLDDSQADQGLGNARSAESLNSALTSP